MEKPHRVVVLLLDGALPLDVGIPSQVFGTPRGLGYELSVCGVRAGSVRGAAGFDYAVDGGLEVLDTADTIIVPGFVPELREIEPEVLDALRAAYDRGTRIASICLGAFALAAAGLLDGRRASTHWMDAGDLARLYPRIEVDASVLYVDEGQVLTSGGAAAGIDLCLHLVRRDHGTAAANAVARGMVAAPHREGGQAQFVRRTLPDLQGDDFARTREWALGRLAEVVTVKELADHARVSVRTFSRRFVEDTGTTPQQWLLAARIDLARELLELSDLGVDQIAASCGVGTAANLRRHFQRLVGVSPGAYRRSFGG